ncbi:hypothetical protein GCM10027347_44690 [Larkinella harenae]
MSSLADFLPENTDPQQLSVRIPLDNVGMIPKSNFIALALVDRNTLPNFGEEVTIPGETPITLSASNLVATIKELTFLGKAWFFGEGTVNGRKAKPEEMLEPIPYGTRTEQRATGEVKETVDIDFKYMFLNIAFFNSLRAGKKAFDTYLFTNKSVQVVRFDTENPVFKNIGHELTGEFGNDIAGSFSLIWNHEEGELIPTFGIKDNELKAEELRYTFGAFTVTGAVVVPGTVNRFTLATGTAAELTRPVLEKGSPRYSIFKNAKEPIGNLPVTIDTNTGEVNIASTLAAGRHKFTVAVENETGIFGSYTFEVQKAA